MASSEERALVARALRGDPNDTLIPQTRDGFEWMTFHEAAYRFWDMCRRVRSAADVNIERSTCRVLADLIDPGKERTCRNVSNVERGDATHGPFVCSECGAWSPYRWSMTDYVTRTLQPIGFCPNCGARVVSASAN